MSKTSGQSPRIAKVDKQWLVSELCKAGFHTWTGKPGSEWIGISSEEDAQPLGWVVWQTGRGWVLQLDQPPTYTQQDLPDLIRALHRTRAAIDRVDAAWDEYKGSRSLTRWLKYRGQQAAHWLRLTPTEETTHGD